MFTYCKQEAVAKKFDVSTRTVRRWVQAKEIPFRHVLGRLRFPIELLDPWADAPELVAKRWFAGEYTRMKKGVEDGSKKTPGQEVGSALFLYGRRQQVG